MECSKNKRSESGCCPMKHNFENRTDIVRDSHSSAILSTNKAAYLAAKKRKEDQERYIKLEQDVKQFMKRPDIVSLIKSLK